MRSGAFSKTAAYYDMLYQDKKYTEEALYIYSLLQKYAPGGKKILELGCGTGCYTREFVKLGCEVQGVDICAEMLNIATQRSEPGTVFTVGDMRTFRAGRIFDAVISMFHVVSYLPGNNDLDQAFRAVAEHLEPGGVFLFDCWYGPAVLTDRPETRIRRLSEDGIELVRIAEPTLDASTSTVNVDYQLFITDQKSGIVTSFQENHCLRYLFEPELSLLLAKNGLALEHSEEFMSGQPLGFSTWYGCFVACKQ